MDTKIFREVKNGWEVYPSKRAKLPGIFLNFTQAQRAYDQYINTGKAAKANRNQEKR